MWVLEAARITQLARVAPARTNPAAIANTGGLRLARRAGLEEGVQRVGRGPVELILRTIAERRRPDPG
jgi:hypothetical protein